LTSAIFTLKVAMGELDAFRFDEKPMFHVEDLTVVMEEQAETYGWWPTATFLRF
jgi:hypothetical protein